MSLYFYINYKAPNWVRKIFGPPVSRWLDIKSWFRSRFVRKYRHHVVYTDLKPGWCDADYVMERAIVALVRRYVDWELEGSAFPDEPGTGYEKLLRIIGEEKLREKKSPEQEDFEDEEDFHKDWDNFHRDVLKIYDWFVFEKPELERQRDEALMNWADSNRHIPLFGPKPVEIDGTEEKYYEMNSRPHGKESFERSRELDKKIDSTTDEMLLLAVKQRRGMWT